MLGLQLSDFRRSGTGDDFDSDNIDVRGFLSSLRLMRTRSQVQYRTLRKRKGETDSGSPEPAAVVEGGSAEENKIAILGLLRIAKTPVRKRTYQELRCPSKSEGGWKSGDNEDSFQRTAIISKRPEFIPLRGSSTCDN